MLKKYLLVVLLLLIGCREKVPQKEITFKTNELDKVSNKDLNGYLTINTYHNKLIQYGGYIEGVKFGVHKFYNGRSNLLYKIDYEKNKVVSQLISIRDRKGNPLYDIKYKNGKPDSFIEKVNMGLPKAVLNQILLNRNGWFLVNKVSAIGDFNSDGIKDFAFKYRQDYKYKIVVFISSKRTNSWMPIFQSDYRNKDILNRFNNEDAPDGIFLKTIEGIDCLDDGNGTVIFYDEKQKQFKYYVYD